jgi:hypothetical protein
VVPGLTRIAGKAFLEVNLTDQHADREAQPAPSDVSIDLIDRFAGSRPPDPHTTAIWSMCLTWPPGKGPGVPARGHDRAR